MQHTQKHIFLLTLKVGMVVLALIAPFFFPLTFALFIALGAALLVPLSAIIVGLLFDLLYFNGVGLAYFSIIGVLAAIGSTLVQQFIKTRIMS